MILSGKLKIGEKLPSERQLAEMMQVSRAVVNGGLSDLEKNGFIVMKPRSGSYVADYRRKGNLNTLLAIMRYNGGRIRNQEIRSIFEVRLALDSIVTNLAIRKMTDEELDVLKDIVEKMRTDSQADAVQAAFDFQHELALYSGNTLIPLIFQSFKSPIFTMWHRFCDLYGIECLYERNYKMWTYLRDRDLNGAIAWVEESVNDCIFGNHQIYYD
jgi:DNA-binding FadR family transcriptional regulator